MPAAEPVAVRAQPTVIPPTAQPEPGPSGHRPARLLRDPLAVVLVLVTVIALALAGLIGAELIARHIADGKVAAAAACEVQDKASASFGMTPPFLWQHITGDYTDISIHTAGNQVKEAKQMTADINIADVNLHGTGDSRGTIGTLQVTLTWPAAGIQETVQSMIPILGNAVSGISTNAQNGTVELNVPFATITVKPEVVDGGLSLKVLNLSSLGIFTLPRELIQPALDEFATALTKKYPLGLRADAIEVTDTGVVARFSAHNATIPRTDNPCFAHL